MTGQEKQEFLRKLSGLDFAVLTKLPDMEENVRRKFLEDAGIPVPQSVSEKDRQELEDSFRGIVQTKRDWVHAALDQARAKQDRRERGEVNQDQLSDAYLTPPDVCRTDGFGRDAFQPVYAEFHQALLRGPFALDLSRPENAARLILVSEGNSPRVLGWDNLYDDGGTIDPDKARELMRCAENGQLFILPKDPIQKEAPVLRKNEDGTVVYQAPEEPETPALRELPRQVQLTYQGNTPKVGYSRQPDEIVQPAPRHTPEEYPALTFWQKAANWIRKLFGGTSSHRTPEERAEMDNRKALEEHQALIASLKDGQEQMAVQYGLRRREARLSGEWISIRTKLFQQMGTLGEWQAEFARLPAEKKESFLQEKGELRGQNQEQLDELTERMEQCRRDTGKVRAQLDQSGERYGDGSGFERDDQRMAGLQQQIKSYTEKILPRLQRLDEEIFNYKAPEQEEKGPGLDGPVCVNPEQTVNINETMKERTGSIPEDPKGGPVSQETRYDKLERGIDGRIGHLDGNLKLFRRAMTSRNPIQAEDYTTMPNPNESVAGPDNDLLTSGFTAKELRTLSLIVGAGSAELQQKGILNQMEKPVLTESQYQDYLDHYVFGWPGNGRGNFGELENSYKKMGESVAEQTRHLVNQYIETGDYRFIGLTLAKGIRRNNEHFRNCADLRGSGHCYGMLNKNLISLMTRRPEFLQAAKEEGLTDEDIITAKATALMASQCREGMRAQSRILQALRPANESNVPVNVRPETVGSDEKLVNEVGEVMAMRYVEQAHQSAKEEQKPETRESIYHTMAFNGEKTLDTVRRVVRTDPDVRKVLDQQRTLDRDNSLEKAPDGIGGDLARQFVDKGAKTVDFTEHSSAVQKLFELVCQKTHEEVCASGRPEKKQAEPKREVPQKKQEKGGMSL